MRSGVAFLCAAVVGAVCVTEVAAQGHPDQWSSEVLRSLADARDRFGPGSVVGAGPHLGVLVEGEMTTVTMPLAAGVTYVAIAACDRDCGRLSLRIADPRRYELDVDRSDTRRPALHFTTVVAGAHRVDVIMTECRVSPCRFGLLLMALPRRTGTSGEARAELLSPDARSLGTPPLLAGPALDLRPRRGDARRRRRARRAASRPRRGIGEASARGAQVPRGGGRAPRPRG